jgi:phosphocarrier protein HPr
MTERTREEGAAVEGSAIVSTSTGLHARPAIKLSRLARQFESRIEVRVDGQGDWVDAKSIVRLMALRVGTGQRLDFLARGKDAGSAVAALSDLIGRNFDEPDGHANG